MQTGMLAVITGFACITVFMAGTVTGIQYMFNRTVIPSDVIVAFWTGAATANTGFWGKVGWNTGMGALGSVVKGG